MERYLTEMFCVSLSFTIVTELIVIFCLSWLLKRCEAPLNGRKILLIILVNLLTNPPAVLLCWLGRVYLPESWSLPVQVAVETVVVITEAYVYCSFARKPQWEIKPPVLMAVAANLCSWLLGLPVQGHVSFSLHVEGFRTFLYG